MSNPYAPPTPDRAPDGARGDAGGVDGGGAGRQDGAPHGDGPRSSGAGSAPHPRRPVQGPRPPQPGPRGPQPGPHGHRPGGPHGPRTGAPGPVDVPPPDPAVLAAVGRRVRHFGAFLIAGVLVSMLPAPWYLAALVFLAGALVYGVIALRQVVRARLRGGLVVMLAVGLGLTALLTTGTAGTLLMWPVESEHQECLRGALTTSGQAECARQYEDALTQWSQRLTGRSAG